LTRKPSRIDLPTRLRVKGFTGNDFGPADPVTWTLVANAEVIRGTIGSAADAPAELVKPNETVVAGN